MSTIILRPYQTHLVDCTFNAWNAGAKNVCVQLPTGGGKTIIFSHIIKLVNEPTWVIAHRQEIVHQISTALAKYKVTHNMVGQKAVRDTAIRAHMRKFGEDFIRPNSKIIIAGVDTIARRFDRLRPMCEHVKLWVTDEGHHVLRNNKWGKATELFPNARGLTVTATPGRLDGYGLGRHADGIIDVLIRGASMSELQRLGFLSPYRLFGPFTKMDLSGVGTSKDGDFNRKRLKAQVRKSTIVGDVVGTYIKNAYGKLGLTFATDVETATDFANAYNAQGVPAEVVTAKTPAAVRDNIFERFQNRELLQVVSVDILGEGFDCPAAEVGSFARPTLSLIVYLQQIGRILRVDPLNPNKVAMIFDHVGNCIKHGLPEKERSWSLNRADRKKRDENDIPVRICPACTSAYESVKRVCPYCGFYPEPQSRSGPQFVDGDLTELTPEVLAALQNEVDRIHMPTHLFREKISSSGCMSRGAILGATKQHSRRLAAQESLCEAIALWGGYQRARQIPDSESYRAFYYKFGYDVYTAQTLGRPDAEALRSKIETDIQRG